jgi:hypothetical protein
MRTHIVGATVNLVANDQNQKESNFISLRKDVYQNIHEQFPIFITALQTYDK